MRFSTTLYRRSLSQISRLGYSTCNLLYSFLTLTATPTPPVTPVTPAQIPRYRAPGQIATNWELATGAERAEYLAKLAGQDPWEDLHPITLTEPGTTANPIIVKGVDPERYIGCTGRFLYI